MARDQLDARERQDAMEGTPVTPGSRRASVEDSPEARREPTVGARLRIRVNPAFDLERDPSAQDAVYVDPDALNNDLITIANEMVRLAEIEVAAMQENKQLRLRKRKLERILTEFETRLMAEDPLSPTEAKSLKLTAAAVLRRVADGGYTAWVEQRRTRLAQLENRIAENAETIQMAKLYWETAERLSDNIKTHLAYVKEERRRA